MRGGPALILHSARRIRTLVFVVGMLLAGFQILLSLAARTAQESKAFQQLYLLVPDFLRQMMGPSLIALMSFSGIVSVGYFHIAVVGALVGLTIALATEPAAEIESRFIDLILSRPLARHWLITRSIILILGSTIFLLTAMAAGSLIGLYWLAPQDMIRPSLLLVRAMIVNLAALMLCWGGLTQALASFARRRSVPGALAGLLALTGYLIDYLARLWRPAAKISWLFPFHYYSGMDLITGRGIPWRDIAILVGYALCGFAVAYVQFSRRDL